MTINDRVKFLRKELGLNQENFGQRVGIARGHMANIETGRREVTEKTIKVICLQFGVNEQWLRHGIGDIFIIDDNEIDRLVSKYNLSPTARALIEVYVQFDDKHRQIFDEMVQRMATGIFAAAGQHEREAMLDFEDGGTTYEAIRSRYKSTGGSRDLLAAANGDTDGIDDISAAYDNRPKDDD